MIAPISIMVAILTVKLIYDYIEWKRHIQTKHTPEWWYVAVASVFPIYQFTEFSRLSLVPALIIATAMCMAFIWVFFNGLYNVIRKQNWWFLGDDSPHSSKTDKFLRKFNPAIRKIMEVGLLVITLTLYIIFLKK